VTILSSGYLSKQEHSLVGRGKLFAKKSYDNIDFVHFKTIRYRGNGIRRMLSIFFFAISIYVLRKKIDKPDIILHNIHAPFDGLISLVAKRYKADYIAEAWDLWPESFVKFGLIGPRNPLLHLAYKVERYLYWSSSKIIFSFEGGADYIRGKGWHLSGKHQVDLSKVYYINNGIDLIEFDRNKNLYKIADDDLISEKIFRVIYVGAINYLNDIKQLIRAAEKLRDIKNIMFLIYGDGSQREALIKYCLDNKLNNVIFKERWIDYKYIPYILSRSSLNIMNYEKGFGDYGVSSGKLFLYLASGKPVCCNIKMNYCLITENNLGIAENLDTEELYAKAIWSLYNINDKERDLMGQRSRKVSEEFDFEILSRKLLAVIEDK
jgi:glycosyltransferase involved in cell wall biosynthesis